jgi:hypothetical protein
MKNTKRGGSWLTGRKLENVARNRQQKQHREIGHRAQGTMDTTQMHGKR